MGWWCWVEHKLGSVSLFIMFYVFMFLFFRRFGDRHRKLMQLASAYDNLSAKQCHGKPLPCSLNNTAICTPQEDADAIYRLGNYEYAYKSVIAFSLVLVLADGDDEYSYRWRMAENSTLYSALTMGAWFIELQDHINGKIDGSNNVKYFHKWVNKVQFWNFDWTGMMELVLRTMDLSLLFSVSSRSTKYVFFFFRAPWEKIPILTREECIANVARDGYRSRFWTLEKEENLVLILLLVILYPSPSQRPATRNIYTARYARHGSLGWIWEVFEWDYPRGFGWDVCAGLSK